MVGRLSVSSRGLFCPLRDLEAVERRALAQRKWRERWLDLA
jgi:hypothetical protein